MIDMHTHHERCGHAKGSIVDYLDAGTKKGLRVMGISDHAPLFAEPEDHPQPGIQMARSHFDGYLDEAQEHKERFGGRLDVRIGVEADFIPGTEELYERALSDSRIDYIIGSVHAFGDYHVFRPRTWRGVAGAETLYKHYYSAIRAAARSGLFDVLGHIDALKALGPEVDGALDSIVDETLEVIADAGVAVEVNTSGIRKCGEPFPSPAIVRRLHAAGVSLTYGSDCHRPDEVAYGWPEVRSMLRDIGVDSLVTFEKRRPKRIPLE